MKKLTFLMLALCLLAGCGLGPAEKTGQHLPVTVVKDSDDKISNYYFTTADLNGNYEGNLYYTFLEEVNIEINGKRYPLEEAIQNGYITVEQLVALAQADAREGLCRETSLTENGLTQFTYIYQDNFKLESINDILETPDANSTESSVCPF